MQESELPSASATASTADCPVCGRRFDRPEHLRRHVATHTKDRRLECDLCTRTFSRKDALDRHKKVHRPHKPLSRFRACAVCATVRVKCSGNQPCDRCQKRRLTCTFPQQANTSRPYTDGESSRTSEALISNHEQQQQQQPQSETTASQSATETSFPPAQMTDTTLFANDDISHAISSLNWISPSFDFDLAEMTYDLMDTSEQYWEQPNDATTFSDQATVSQTSPTRTDQSISQDADNTQGSYVDDAGARRPRSGRYADKVLGDANPTDSRHGIPVETPSVEYEPAILSINIPEPITLDIPIATDLVSDAQYTTLVEHFHQLCSTPRLPADWVFDTTFFPTITAVRACVGLYFTQFDPKVIPFIRQDTIRSLSSQSWVLVLGMAATGSQYHETCSQSTVLAMHEFLCRVLSQTQTLPELRSLSWSAVHVAQARVLNHIGISYCGSQKLQKHMATSLTCLVQDFLYLHSSHGSILREHSANPGDFLFEESIRRLCHTIWLLDTSSRYQLGTHPSLLLDYTDILLPCKEDLWLSADTTPSPVEESFTLERALTVLYVEKRLLKNVGDFARVLLIHALYCQTWVVARSLNRPLLQWTPSAQKGFADTLKDPTWLPSIPRYNQWRNAACDCIDVLHWIANSDTAMTGTENTTTFHLHFSRIVLLAPYDSIRELGSLLISTDTPNPERIQELLTSIKRWITEDQFKARLAMIHCGVFFWHVRRYSVDAFYEPVAVYLTTLVVWAYGSLCPPRPRRRQTNGDDESEYSSDVDKISSIRLDRPTDDELVQLFIKRGRGMKATLMGVGDVAGSRGPGRMLREGCRLLGTLGRWRVRDGYLRELGALMRVCGEGREWVGRVGA